MPQEKVSILYLDNSELWDIFLLTLLWFDLCYLMVEALCGLSACLQSFLLLVLNSARTMPFKLNFDHALSYRSTLKEYWLTECVVIYVWLGCSQVFTVMKDVVLMITLLRGCGVLKMESLVIFLRSLGAWLQMQWWKPALPSFLLSFWWCKLSSICFSVK